MKALVILIPALFLTACSNQSITEMGSVEQPNDLRDLDYDGVIEAREKCGETLPGAQVDNNGCAEEIAKTEAVNLDVKFDNDSSVVKTDYYPVIESLATLMKKYQDSTVVIEGHASLVGNAEYNLSLSQARADAIASVLTSQFSIDNDRVRAVGYGETQPVVDGESDYANEINRRVIANLSGQFDSTKMKWTIYTPTQ